MSFYSSPVQIPSPTSSFPSAAIKHTADKVSCLLNLVPIEIRNQSINHKTLQEIVYNVINKQESIASFDRQDFVAQVIAHLTKNKLNLSEST